MWEYSIEARPSHGQPEKCHRDGPYARIGGGVNDPHEACIPACPANNLTKYAPRVLSRNPDFNNVFDKTGVSRWVDAAQNRQIGGERCVSATPG